VEEEEECHVIRPAEWGWGSLTHGANLSHFLED
jgi:hypothetical protein